MVASEKVTDRPLERIVLRLAWLPLVLTILFAIGGLWLLLRVPTGEGPATIGVSQAIGYLTAWISFSAVGGIIVSRAPSQIVGWLCCALGTGIAAVGLAASVATYGLALDPPAPWALTAAWLAHSLAGPMVAVMTLLLLVLPNGRLASRRWRPVPVIAGVSAIGLAIGLALAPIPLVGFPGYSSPYGLHGAAGAIALGLTFVSGITFICTVLLGVAAVILRYRRSTGDERRQLQWIAFGGAAFFVAVAVAILLSPNVSAGQFSSAGHFISSLGFAAVAVGIGIAVTRYRLYDIDVVIDRSIVYGGLTAILAGLYAASIRLFNALFVAATGEQSEVPLVITTLLLATTFTPVKKRLEDIVERRYKTPDEPPALAATVSAETVDDQSALEAHDERVREIVRDELAKQGR